ncbi:N-acetylmuramoyl-L-alanine amidase [Fodinicola acaciae]|uniref:N-acetylmuramoyl-L-alanine amidase n=1 Tax=Fodinicola acaciae TaxID=2681555 RepID=UPI0013D740F4|nr:N-acetylmuramoyl-L-alanine amidase [Fodinicola acaciae]
MYRAVAALVLLVSGLLPVQSEPAATPSSEVDIPLGAVKRAGAMPPTVHLTRTGLTPFSLVGVTWRADPAVTGVSVAVRTRAGDAAWSDWQTESAEDAGQVSERTGTGPIWTGAADAIEVAVRTVAGQPPRDLRLALIDPGTSPADAKPQPTLMKAGRPAIYPRSGWRPDPRLMTWRPSFSPRVKAIAFHHTATSNSYTRAQVPAILRGIYRYQAVTLKWGDIGYNAIVDRFGRIWEGRFGGLDKAPIGAHAGGFNYETLGVALLGDFSKAAPPVAMRNAAAAYIAWELGRYHVNPTGTTTLTGGPNTRYRTRVTVRVPTVFPHRQTSVTECPGDGGTRVLPGIRYQASRRIG